MSVDAGGEPLAARGPRRRVVRRMAAGAEAPHPRLFA